MISTILFVQQDDSLFLQSVHVLFLLSATLLSRNLSANTDFIHERALLETPETNFLNLYLIFDLPADLLQRLLLGLGEGQFGGNRVAFGHQCAPLLFGQDQGAGALQLLHPRYRN